jgi:hypothetical protein
MVWGVGGGCAGESPARPLYHWVWLGERQELVGQICCCAFIIIKKKTQLQKQLKLLAIQANWIKTLMSNRPRQTSDLHKFNCKTTNPARPFWHSKREREISKGSVLKEGMGHYCKQVLHASSFFCDCPFSCSTCVSWCPDTSWSCPNTHSFGSYYAGFNGHLAQNMH